MKTEIATPITWFKYALSISNNSFLLPVHAKTTFNVSFEILAHVLSLFMRTAKLFRLGNAVWKSCTSAYLIVAKRFLAHMDLVSYGFS